MNKLNITEYNLFDYSLRLQEAFEKGYHISDSVNDSPMKIGNAYTATVSIVEKEPTIIGELAVKVSVDTTELQEQLKQGGDIEQAIEAALVVEESEQAKIDTDMLENNPEEMSEDQVNNLAEKQVKFVEPVVEETVVKAPSKRGRK